MGILLYTIGVLLLTAGLAVFSYLDRVYRELGRVHTSRVHEHLDTFESETEPHLHLERRRASLSFSLIARFFLVLVAVFTARGVNIFVPTTWEAALEMVFFLGGEVVVAMQFLPALLLARAPGDWLNPLVPLVRAFVYLIWPIQVVLELLISVLHISDDDESAPPAAEQQQQAIEALVDAATEEGIIEHDDARLIEQVVEFGDKRIREVMTPRPDIVAVRASASIEELRDLLVETKFSRLPVYEKSLDDITGIAMARDILEIPDRDAGHRKVRELMRPALFVPETKLGSELLKEMQRKNQQMAIVIDEYGLLAGVVTIEDLVEEIVGEIGDEDRHPAPDVIREPGGSMILRGSAPVEKVGELFGAQLEADSERSATTTIAGLLSGIAGHVPRTGETFDAGGLRFEVLEANQRKVLRVRARRMASSAASSSARSI
jgi:CBS domain containing-hemolysin-like protein